MKRLGILLLEPDAAFGAGALLMLLLGVISAAVPNPPPVFCAVTTLSALIARIALRKVITIKRAAIVGSVSAAQLSGALSALLVCAVLCAAYLMPVIILPPLCFCVLPPALELILCAAGFIIAFVSLLCSVLSLLDHGFYAAAMLMVFTAFPAIAVIS